MKYFGLILTVMMVGCAQLMNGQEQPVRLLKSNVYITTCSGAVETWTSCSRKAEKTCNGKYKLLEKNESVIGAKREFTFECTK